MRMMIFVLLTSCSIAVQAQQGVTRQGDTGLEALMNKVEGQSDEQTKRLINDFKAEEGKDYQTGAAEMAERYYKAILEDDLIAAYELMSKTYRKAVSLQNYLKKDRIKLQEVHITGLKFASEQCARVSGTTKGVAGNRIGSLALPVRLRIFLEDGRWVVHSNPYQQMGFQLPNAKGMSNPCKY